jgi:hypothetical protein
MEALMNLDKMAELRDHIAGVPEQACHMDTWIGSGYCRDLTDDLSQLDDGTYELPLLDADGQCGTSGCIAGHAVALFTGNLSSILDRSGEVIGHFNGKGVKVDPGEEATRLLDLSTAQSVSLFYERHWPSSYQQEMKQENARKAMLHLLTDIVDGLVVWDEEFKTWVTLDELEERLAAEFTEDEE